MSIFFSSWNKLTDRVKNLSLLFILPHSVYFLQDFKYFVENQQKISTEY